MAHALVKSDSVGTEAVKGGASIAETHHAFGRPRDTS